MRRPPRLVVLSCLAAQGCGGDFTHSFNRVDELRLLAARAEPPEVTSGETTTVTALVVSPLGAARPIEWAACALPAVPGEGPVNRRCLDEDRSAPWFVERGTGNPWPFTLRAESAAQLEAALTYPDATGGYYLPLRARLSDEAGGTLDAVYRLRYARQPGPRNTNPEIAAVELLDEAQGAPSWVSLDEGAPRAVAARSRVTLRARLAPGSAETYAARLADGSERQTGELPSLTWFTSAGDYDRSTTGDGSENQLLLEAHLPAPGSAIDLWVVVRDERGGVGWTHRALTLR